MQKLPLFPLNSVLFPGMPISLHIFEERYKLMINQCIDRQEPFGVVLLKSGSEVKALGGDAIPYSIGCTALITQVQPVGMGRMNILAIGQERFQITGLNHEQPYLVGQVELLPLKNEDPAAANRDGRLLRPWVERYLNVLGRAENIQFESDQLPMDTLSLAYFAASLLKVSMAEKQDILASDHASQLLDKTRRLYRKEVTLLEALMERVETGPEGPFSLN